MTTAQYLESLFLLLGGLGAFLYGVKELSDNMEKLTNRRLKALFQKTSKNPLVGIGIGTVATAIVQSSGLTTVMVVGFVNAGMMSLYQATAFIMGSKIGTTITAQIAALQSFDVAFYAIGFAFIGMAINMIAKRQKVKSAGLAIAGLGLIFVGLNLMSASMDEVKHSDEVMYLLSKVSNPLLLIIIGIVVTALVQSSSVVTTVIISMAAAGLTIGDGGNAPLYIVLGSNIGSCVTAFISSIDASTDAKRASFINILFNVFGAIIFTVMLLLWPSFMDVTFGRWFIKPATQIAMFHTAVNLANTLIFLPFINGLVWLSKVIIKERKKKNDELSFIDVRFLSAPTVAIEQSNKEAMRIADIAMNSLRESFTAFIERNTDAFENIAEKTGEVNELSKKLTDYLIRISSYDLTINDEKRISILHNNNSDIVRLAEIADNFIKYTSRAVREDITFSEGVSESLQEMFATLDKLFELSKQARLTKDRKLLKAVDEEEDRLDNFRRQLIADHIDRLNRGECKAASSSVYINLVSNLERAGDHLCFIAHTIEEVA
ncbi:MAG: Na/Pi cotransporter family protein [Clostridia bacterium]|nr:Na/Pi cotransporter family protein [Clostridia bacterium]MBQ9481779.1 Na/Pi cotransporter family protein [Clostridia bacterium]